MKTTWWLDHSALPDLYWARLRVFNDGHAEILDLGGRVHQFTSEEEALLWLTDDEYLDLDYLIEEGEVPAGTEPPQADTDEELGRKMLQKVD